MQLYTQIDHHTHANLLSASAWPPFTFTLSCISTPCDLYNSINYYSQLARTSNVPRWSYNGKMQEVTFIYVQLWLAREADSRTMNAACLILALLLDAWLVGADGNSTTPSEPPHSSNTSSGGGSHTESSGNGTQSDGGIAGWWNSGIPDHHLTFH